MASLIPWKRRSEEKGGTALVERPRDAFALMRRELDSLFERFFSGWPTLSGDLPVAGWGFDVDDAGNEIVVHAEAPGFEAGDFNVEIVGDNLVLKAERKEEEGKEGNGYRFRQERLYRTVSLPHGVEADKIDARYHNGVLEVRIPKGKEALGKRIEVKST
jgi:HSP20 family protein